jgi:hypothetical protein
VPSADILATIISRIARDAAHAAVGSVALQQPTAARVVWWHRLLHSWIVVVQWGCTTRSEGEEQDGEVDWRGGCNSIHNWPFTQLATQAGRPLALCRRSLSDAPGCSDICECSTACGIQAYKHDARSPPAGVSASLEAARVHARWNFATTSCSAIQTTPNSAKRPPCTLDGARKRSITSPAGAVNMRLEYLVCRAPAGEAADSSLH